MTIIVTLPSTLTNGTTADASQVMADLQALVNGFLLAAEAGANTSITSLSGLTTPLSIAQGGTGAVLPALWDIAGCMLVVTNTTLTITPGFAMDTVSGTPTLMTLATKYTKTLGGTWMVGSGNAAGGSFTAGVLVDIWLIRNPSNSVVDIFAAIALTWGSLPTFPAGYTQARRIGSIVANSDSHMLGNLTLLDQPGGLPNDVYNSTVDITTTAVSVTTNAPPLADAWLFGGTIKSSAGACAINIYTTDVAVFSAPQPNIAGAPGAMGYSPVAGQTTLFETWVSPGKLRVNTLVNVRANAASTTYSLWLKGWYDSRQGSA